MLARCFAVEGYPGSGKTRSELWALAERLLPQQLNDSRTGSGRSRIAAYTQGMMDLGATLCTRTNPDCPQCPLQPRCLARQRGEIDRYPGKKPAKTLPVRSVTMLILQDSEGRVLLEKRPPNGIWGSLYSLPQIETHDGAPTLPASLSGLRLANEPPAELPPIRHGFTHFQLDITPLHYRVAQTASAVAESGRWLWYSIADPAEVGLAAPVRKLLAALASAEPQRPGSSMKREEP